MKTVILVLCIFMSLNINAQDDPFKGMNKKELKEYILNSNTQYELSIKSLNTDISNLESTLAQKEQELNSTQQKLEDEILLKHASIKLLESKVDYLSVQLDSLDRLSIELKNKLNIAISQKSILIKESQVDIFKVGDKVPNNGLISGYTIIGVPDEAFYGEEGTEYYLDVYYVLLDSDTIITIKSDYSNKDIIGEIEIFSDKPRTKEGIGVGSTIEDFALEYEDYSIWWSYITDICCVSTREYNNLQFFLNLYDLKDGTPDFDSDMTSLELSDFQPHTKINSIRLY